MLRERPVWTSSDESDTRSAPRIDSKQQSSCWDRGSRFTEHNKDRLAIFQVGGLCARAGKVTDWSVGKETTQRGRF